MCGYIKLHRQIMKWEWYEDVNTFKLFMHLLLKASTTNRSYKGIKIKKGQLITSRGNLASETGLSVQQVRTCIEKLQATNEISVNTNNSYTTITVKKWQDYQFVANDNQPVDNQVITDNQPTSNQVVTNDQPSDNQAVTTVKEVKNDKNVINKKTNKKETFINSVEPQYQKPLREWLDYKKDLKTEKQWQYQYNKLIKFDIPQEVVNDSIGNGWKGLFLKIEDNKKQPNHKQSAVEVIEDVSSQLNNIPEAHMPTTPVFNFEN